MRGLLGQRGDSFKLLGDLDAKSTTSSVDPEQCEKQNTLKNDLAGSSFSGRAIVQSTQVPKEPKPTGLKWGYFSN